MKVTKLLQRATSMLLALAMLFSFPAGVFSEGTGSKPEKAPDIPEGFVWRTLSVEAAPFEEDCAETEEAEAERWAEKLHDAARFLELMLSHKAELLEEDDEEKDEKDEKDENPVIEVRGWMPEDVTARAELIVYADEDLYKELALAQVELRFYDAAGQRWTPEYPLTVCLDGEMLEELRDAEMDPTVYVYEELPLDEEAPEELNYAVEAFSAARSDDEELSYECEREDDDLHAEVCERALTKVEEIPDAVCFETQSAGCRFLLTARQQERSFTAVTEDGAVEMALVGALPRALTALVNVADAEASSALPGDVVRAWDISLRRADDESHSTDGTVKVALRDKALTELKSDVWDLQLWQLQPNGEYVRVKDALFKDENLRFSTPKLGTFVVVQVAIEKRLTATDGKSYSVQVSYDSRAGIPAGAELNVREIAVGDAEYTRNMKQCAARIGQDASAMDFARMFDITLRDPKTGMTYQPTRDMQVKIDLLSEDLTEYTKINVLRLGQKAELMDTAAVKGAAVSFAATGSSSVYVVTGVTLEKTITAGDGKTYEVSVSYDKDAGIPAGAELRVERLTGADYMEYLSKTAEFLSREEEQLVYNCFLDISIVKDGVVYEPNDAVTVSIRLLDEHETTGVLRVVHFGEEKTELLENCVLEDGCLSFDTKSFSVYAITDEHGNLVVPRAFYYFKDGPTDLGRQIIKNGGALLEPEHSNQSNQFFLGWYIYDETTGKYGEQIEFNDPVDQEDPNSQKRSKAISVILGNQASIEADTIVVPKIKDNDGKWVNHVDITLQTRYTTNYRTIKYKTAAEDPNSKLTVDSETVAMEEDQDSTIFEIPAASKWEDKIPNHEDFIFVGWSEDPPPVDGNGNYNYYSGNDVDSRTPATSITVYKHIHGENNEDDDDAVYLYPVFKQAHWLSFKTGPAGSTADYVRPVYVLNGETTEGKKPDPDPSWSGYVFKYWTTENTFDENGNVKDYEKLNYWPEEYQFNSAINEDTLLYACWDPGYTTYTVITWQQDIKNAWDIAPSDRTYKFYAQETREAKVGDSVELTEADKTQVFTGFHHRDNDNGGLIDSETTTVQPSGVTVLSVYYDRDILKMQFYRGNGGYPAGGYTSTIWDSGDTRITTYTGLYGQPLSQYGKKWPDGTWTYFSDTKGGTTGISYLGQFIYPDENPKYEVFRAFKNSNTGTERTITFYRMGSDGNYHTNDPSLKDTGKLSDGGIFYFSEKYDGFKVAYYQRYYYNNRNQRVNLDSNLVSCDSNGTCDLRYYYDNYNRVYRYPYLDIYYDRQAFTINYFNSMDGLPLMTTLQNGDSVKTVSNVFYERNIAEFYPSESNELVAKEKGYSFNGRWYSDRDKTTQIFFRPLTQEDEKKLWYYVDPAINAKMYVNDIPTDTSREYFKDKYEVMETMPNRNLALYAGFDKTWYWVKFDPNGGSLNQNDPQKYDDVTYIWKQYGDELDMPETQRDFIQDPAGTYYYHYDEFNTEKPTGVQPLTRKAYYTTDVNDATDQNTRYRPVIDSEEGYTFTSWYRVETVNGREKYTKFNFDDDRVTGNIVLRAMWKQKGEFRVLYCMDKAVDSTGVKINGITPAWHDGTSDTKEDEDTYALESAIVIQDGTVHAVVPEGDTTLYSFLGWYIGGVYGPGECFIANPFLASLYPGAPETAREDTFILYPVFEKKSDIGDLSGRTSLILDANGGSRTENFKEEYLPEHAYFKDDAHVYYADSKTQITDGSESGTMSVNMDAELPLPDNNAGKPNVFSRTNAEFLGWATNPDSTTPDFIPGQLVGVDNINVQGDAGNTLYAIWRLIEVDVQIKLEDADKGTGISGGSFTLKQGNTEVPGAEGGLISGADGKLAKGQTKQFALKTPLSPSKTNTFTVHETDAAPGYIPMDGDVTIRVRYDGTVTYRLPGDTEFQAAQRQSNGLPLIVMKEHEAICKVVNDNEQETLYARIQHAVDHAKTLNGVSRIEMLDDYQMPAEDFVVVDGNANIVLTTAGKDVKNKYRGDGTVATITRGISGDSMFTVQGGSFDLENIILDGGSKTNKACISDGGIICVQNADVKVNPGTILRNSRVASNTGAQSGGGAIAAIGNGTHLNFAGAENNMIQVLDCSTTHSGGGISLSDGAHATLNHVEILNCSANEKGGAVCNEQSELILIATSINHNEAATGAGVYVSSGAKLKISGAPDFGGPGVNEDGSLITTVGNFCTVERAGEKNARADYPHARQDIYLAETADDPASLVVTGELTGPEGSIWVYAESEKHYQMLMPFAVVEPASLSEESYKVFRNAREDSDTLCASDYLTGQPMANTNFIQWTGGNDVAFLKIDSMGELFAGAEFGLFTDAACTNAFKMSENDEEGVTAVSDEEGVVIFEKLNPGVYYMKELSVADPTKYDVSEDVYVILLGTEFVTVPSPRTDLWATDGVLSEITQDDVDAQMALYEEKFEKKDYAIFLIEDEKAVTTPNIAAYGIVNFYSAIRPVVFSKNEVMFTPLPGAKFVLRSVNGRPMRQGDVSEFESNESGVFFAGPLHYGIYYLEETVAPKLDPADPNSGTYHKPTHYFVIKIDETGIQALRRNDSNGYDFAITNTVTEPMLSDYEIN